MRNLILAVAHFLSSFCVTCTVGHDRDSTVRMFGLQGAREVQWDSAICHLGEEPEELCLGTLESARHWF